MFIFPGNHQKDYSSLAINQEIRLATDHLIDKYDKVIRN